MHIMAYLPKGLLVVLSLVTLSLSQQDDPISGFCRRWGHTTAQVGSRLYIDGGMVGSVPFASNRTSMWSSEQDYLFITRQSNLISQTHGFCTVT